MNKIATLLDNRKNTRCFSDKPVSTEIINDLLAVINRIPAKEQQMPTEVFVLGNNAQDMKQELYVNTECEVDVFNPQLLAPVVFCFCRKENVVDANGVTDPSVPPAALNELHRYYAGMASMAVGLAALDAGLNIGFCQSQGLDGWTGTQDEARGGAITVNGELRKVSLSLGVGYPATETDHMSRARVTGKQSDNMSAESLVRRGLEETRPRPELNSYVSIFGQDDVSLPDTWLNLPLESV